MCGVVVPEIKFKEKVMFKRSVVWCGVICLLWYGNVLAQDKETQQLFNMPVITSLYSGVNEKTTFSGFLKACKLFLEKNVKVKNVVVLSGFEYENTDAHEHFVYYGPGDYGGPAVVVVWNQSKNPRVFSFIFTPNEKNDVWRLELVGVFGEYDKRIVGNDLKKLLSAIFSHI